MRDNLQRVNIVLTEHLLDQTDEEKDSQHGSRSQLIRQALAEYFDGNAKNDTEFCLKPVQRKINELDNTVKDIQNKLKRLDKKIGTMTDKDIIRKVSEDIEKLLLEKEELLSIPDMGEHLPYEQNKLLRGVEKLEDEFLVVRVEQGKLPKWKIRGDKSGC